MLYAIAAVVLVVVCIGSSIADVRKLPQIVESMQRLRVPAQMQSALPVLKVLGAAGLVIGFPVRWFGAVAALALALYFAVATWFHLRVKDPINHTGPALAFCVVAVLALIGAAATA